MAGPPSSIISLIEAGADRKPCTSNSHPVDVSKRQAAALFLIAPMIAVSMAPPAPPATTCEMIPWTLRSPDCAAAVTAGRTRLTIWPSTPPPIKPEIMLPIIPRSNVGDDLPTPAPPRAPAIRLMRICSMLISQPLRQAQDYVSPPDTRIPPGIRSALLSPYGLPRAVVVFCLMEVLPALSGEEFPRPRPNLPLETATVVSPR